MPKKTTKDSASFEVSMQKLDAIVRRLEQGGNSLDAALQDYEEAIGLMKTCHKMLQTAERKVELLSGVDAEGNPISTQIVEQAETLNEKKDARSRKRTASPNSESLAKSKKRSTTEGSELF